MIPPNCCASDVWHAPNNRLTACILSEPAPHLQVTGSLDIAICDDFANYARQAAPYHRGWQIIDMAQLEMLTSSGAGTLIRMASTASQDGGGLLLVVPPGDVRKAIGFMRLDLVIDTFDTLDQAVAFVQSHAAEPAP